MVGALVPMVRYDGRFARAIGKWVLNITNASRLFYPNYLPDDHQDSEVWAHLYDPNSYIAHESMREYALFTGINPRSESASSSFKRASERATGTVFICVSFEGFELFYIVL